MTSFTLSDDLEELRASVRRLAEDKIAPHAARADEDEEYPWDSWHKQYTAEPPVWFHDIFRADGSAYRPEEVAYIKRITGATNS